MIVAAPDASRILCGARTTTGTVVTIPANSTFTANVVISASVSAAATAVPTVTVSGTGGGPADGTVLHRLSITGLALTTVTDSCMTDVLVVSGNNALTLEFNTGGATSASVSVTGFLL